MFCAIQPFFPGWWLMTARSMPAAVACVDYGLTGSTAAGIAEFQGGRAGIPVAAVAFMVLVRFTAGAGVFGGASLC
jgi:hypothetical protein